MDSSIDTQVDKKVFQINLDERIYGTFAEIGAGQEVARRFFHVRRAAGTVAKTMSAYDMTFSDAIYGHSGRYVSRNRLNTMLDHEFQLLLERLDPTVGDKRTFFVFADTVAARSFRRHDESHGWMGVRFQSEPRSPVSEIIIHVRMLDQKNVLQQEALGIIGVNLIYGAFFLRNRPEALISSLTDDLSPDRIEIDMIQFSGSEFVGVDNRLMSLHLVVQGLTKAAMFRSNGEAIQPADAFYKKPLLVERGRFRPVTHVTNDMLTCARRMFLHEEGLRGQEPEVFMEITMQDLMQSGELDLGDFLDRVDILGALGWTVLISNYGQYYSLINYLTRYTDQMIGLPLGIPGLRDILNPQTYEYLEGGILEGLGRLFKHGVKLYVYPVLEPDGSITTVHNYRVASNLRPLYDYLLKNRFLEPIEDYNPEYLPIYSADVVSKIRADDPTWEQLVPKQVAEIIKERHLFRATPKPRPFTSRSVGFVPIP